MASATSIFLFLLGIYLLKRATARKTPPLPPGPPKKPVIDNLLDLPASFEWETYGAWADKWGPLISVSAFGTNIVIVNSYKKAVEMFDEKGHIYSSRPYVPMAVDLMGWDKAMAFTPYGQRFKGYRKVFHAELGNAVALKNYWPQEETHARKFIKLCLAKPDELMQHCFQHAGAIVLRVAYGYTAKDYDDDFIRAGNEAMESFNNGCAPGAFMVNQMPFLKHVPEWVPGAGFQKTARLWRPLYGRMVDTPFNFVEKELAAGTAEDSFTARWLKKDMSSDDKDILKNAAGSMFGGGGETTAITVHMFFLLMAQYPEIQRKAQAEVDSVAGRDRMPAFEDRDQMPYVEALVKEVQRFHPAVPNSLPHATSDEDIHDGYYIPKGTIMVPNIWKMSRDPETYADAETFNPERFMGEKPEQDPRDIIFGFGRRLCPGRLLADASVYITIATCLWAFEISAPLDASGKPQVPKYAAEGGPVNRLKSFKCDIHPRDRETLSQLLQ